MHLEEIRVIKQSNIYLTLPPPPQKKTFGAFFRAVPRAHRGSQARSRIAAVIGAVATGLYHSHKGSEQRL